MRRARGMDGHSPVPEEKAERAASRAARASLSESSGDRPRGTRKGADRDARPLPDFDVVPPGYSEVPTVDLVIGYRGRGPRRTAPARSGPGRR